MQKGQIIAGEFMLQRLLSESVSGEVWRALELNVGRLVRLQFVPETIANDPAVMERLRQDFETVRTFSHPHVIQAERLDLVGTPAPDTFLVSRYVDGPFLDEYAEQWIAAEGVFPFHLIFDVLRPVASALDDAHARNLCHRGLDFRTIVVSQTEGVQLLGFEFTGLNDSTTSKDDQYFLALLVSELISAPPLSSMVDDRQIGEKIRSKIQNASLPNLSSHPDHVSDALWKALSPKPEERFDSCLQFLDALEGHVPVERIPVAKTTVEPVYDEHTPAMPPMFLEQKHPEPVSVVPPPVVVPPLVDPSAPQEEVVSFSKIASEAKSAHAEKVAVKIKKERRFQNMFYVWNLLVLLGCVIALIVYRSHIAKVVKQRTGIKVFSEDSTETFAENVDSFSDVDSKTASNLSPRRSRRTKTPKEENFEEQNGATFRNIGGDDNPDEVRFLGTSAAGKKIVFVIDASAVMGGENLTPWSHTKKELAHSFRDLNQTQWFQVIYFNETPMILPGGEGPEQWIAATPDSLKKSYDFLDKVKGTGTADPTAALEKAFSLKPDVVFFLSDQKSKTIDLAEIDRLKSRFAAVSVGVVEIGEGDEPARKSPLRMFAETFRGEYKWINANFHGLRR